MMKIIVPYIVMAVAFGLAAAPCRRFLRIIFAVIGFALLAFLHLMNQGLWDESNASAGRAINQLSKWVKDGKTNLVCTSIVSGAEIMTNSGFNGMSFEKIVIMSESKEKKSEPEVAPYR